MAMNADEQSIARIIGGLEARVEGFQTSWVEQDRRASEGRKFLFEKMDGVATEVQHLTHTVADVVSDVTEMKPAVRDWVETKQLALGAKTAAGALGKVVYMVGGALLFMAGWLIDHLPTIVSAIK
jgi:hypothetical protein